jgi:hypothetical protein
MKFKMAATAGLSLTLDPMGKMFQNASSLKPLVVFYIAPFLLIFNIFYHINHISGAMESMLALSMVNSRFQPRSGQIRDL